MVLTDKSQRRFFKRVTTFVSDKENRKYTVNVEVYQHLTKNQISITFDKVNFMDLRLSKPEAFRHLTPLETKKLIKILFEALLVAREFNPNDWGVALSFFRDIWRDIKIESEN